MEFYNTQQVKCLTLRHWLAFSPLENCGTCTTQIHEQQERNPKNFKDLSDNCVIAALMNIDSLLLLLWLTQSSWQREASHILTVHLAEIRCSLQSTKYTTLDKNQRQDKTFFLYSSLGNVQSQNKIIIGMVWLLRLHAYLFSWPRATQEGCCHTHRFP